MFELLVASYLLLRTGIRVPLISFKGSGQKTSMFCQGHVVEKPSVNTCATLHNTVKAMFCCFVGFHFDLFPNKKARNQKQKIHKNTAFFGGSVTFRSAQAKLVLSRRLISK